MLNRIEYLKVYSISLAIAERYLSFSIAGLATIYHYTTSHEGVVKKDTSSFKLLFKR